jgi:hypothetical protein
LLQKFKNTNLVPINNKEWIVDLPNELTMATAITAHSNDQPEKT